MNKNFHKQNSNYSPSIRNLRNRRIMNIIETTTSSSVETSKSSEIVETEIIENAINTASPFNTIAEAEVITTKTTKKKKVKRVKKLKSIQKNVINQYIILSIKIYKINSVFIKQTKKGIAVQVVVVLHQVLVHHRVVVRLVAHLIH